MQGRQDQNRARAERNKNENWLAGQLQVTGHRWTRQAAWGYRIFDFWCHELGIAVESDGPEHRPDYDAYRDEYNLRRSGIVVLRIRNMNEADLADALRLVAESETWKERKKRLGLDAHTKAGKRNLVSGQQSLFDNEPTKGDA
jgi:very-short-patch-repair endonuclease